MFTPGEQGPNTDIASDTIALWRTTDGGATWQLMNLGMKGLGNIWQLCFISPSHGYMAVDVANAGLFETVDSGMHWHRLKMQNASFDNNKFISIYAVDSSLYTITGNTGFVNSPQVALWNSSNDGYTWQRDSEVIRPEFITGNRENLLEASGPNGGWYLGINNILDSVIFTSSNSGKTWNVSPGGQEQWNQFILPHTQVMALAEETDLQAMFSAINVSTDAGNNWKIT
ncbi:MAG TPA: hypothetical protein VFH95_15470, partial [Candidatus Kapabacteria bacterium]|nr:hypothetical protein [Candidatus Kapabacteria bacterium]